jgi:hypothetical protein
MCLSLLTCPKDNQQANARYDWSSALEIIFLTLQWWWYRNWFWIEMNANEIPTLWQNGSTYYLGNTKTIKKTKWLRWLPIPTWKNYWGGLQICSLSGREEMLCELFWNVNIQRQQTGLPPKQISVNKWIQTWWYWRCKQGNTSFNTNTNSIIYIWIIWKCENRNK